MSIKTSTKNQLKLLKIYNATKVEWLANIIAYSKIVLVVAIPVAILNIIQANGSIGDYVIASLVAWSFVVMAIITLSTHKKQLINFKLSAIFTLASARFLQYLAVCLVLILCSTPALVGILSMLLPFMSPQIPIYIFVPLGLVSIFIGAYLLTSFSVAQTAVLATTHTTIQALRLSAKLTKGYRIKIFIGFAALIIIALIILFAIITILATNKALNENKNISNLIYLIEATIILPIIFIFQAKLYGRLSE